jgi:tetrahydromethanopterin S-methyltransferase subunit C
MPTSTPPPYFPQNSLLPPDENRARKVKLAVAGCLILLLLFVAGVVAATIYLIRR